MSGIPGWKQAIDFNWENTPFYFPEQSRFWFTESLSKERKALIRFDENNFMLVSDSNLPVERQNQYFSYSAPHLIPLSGASLSEFESALENTLSALNDCHSKYSNSTPC